MCACLEARWRAGKGEPSLLRRAPALEGKFRRKDSNLRSRIQSPLPYPLATPERLPGRLMVTAVEIWDLAALQSMQNTLIGLIRDLWPVVGVPSSSESRTSFAASGVDCRLRCLPLSGRTSRRNRDPQRPGDDCSLRRHPAGAAAGVKAWDTATMRGADATRDRDRLQR